MRQVVVFDFDGTLTKKDTMIEFVAFVRGRFKMLHILLFCLPHLALMKIGFVSNASVKSLFLSKAFGGMTHSELVCFGQSFTDKIEKFIRKDNIAKLKDHLANGDSLYIVTASAEEWIRPWCIKHGVSNIICTRLNYDKQNVFSGQLAGKNCYGQEKVNRFLELEPDRKSYYLIAYGDSNGDKEIINFADEGIWV